MANQDQEERAESTRKKLGTHLCFTLGHILSSAYAGVVYSLLGALPGLQYHVPLGELPYCGSRVFQMTAGDIAATLVSIGLAYSVVYFPITLFHSKAFRASPWLVDLVG